ncbi:MAG: LTA synthase family protein, partial [Sulfurimonas sp.]|nr:LTA synthase family protein [Sulfurimonas sp.]
KLDRYKKIWYKFFRAYYILIVTLLISFAFIDLAYFSFFAEHSTIMIFGVFDDDTEALINTALANYNIPLVTLIGSFFYLIIYFLTFKIIKQKEKIDTQWSMKKQTIFFLLLVITIGVLARGSLGLFPLAKYIPDVSADPFINKLPQTPTYALVYAYKQYKKSKSGRYDLIKDLGYKGKIDKAFMVHLETDNINQDDLLNNITYQTDANEVVKNKPPHVVVVMVESFGMPILSYQSKTFNIMGKIKKHFQEDILFTNFISTGNGTVSSLEALLLNIPSRPGAIALGQSKYLNTSFKQASARVYQDAGYETSFVYGGDLSWRNVGSFMSRQGFDSVKGKAQIVKSLSLDAKKDAHDWGVYDEFSYKYILEKLKNAKKPQFIFLLTTNNHPPYKVPENYKSNKLEFSKELKEHITGDMDLARRRFKDYAYAVDMAGDFLDKLKASPLSENTVVALTADNNTVEGIMRYEDYYTQTKRIPFYIYLPEYLKTTTFDTTLASSHKDIFPTLYNLTLDNVSYMAIGTDLRNRERLRCGFNKAGVLVTNNGGFKDTKAKTDEQKRCVKHYKSSLAVTEFMIQSNKK